MARVIVYHSSYGCETGCCGHIIEIHDDEGHKHNGKSEFYFDHPRYKQEPLDWAKEFIIGEVGKEHADDLDWENSIVVDD